MGHNLLKHSMSVMMISDLTIKCNAIMTLLLKVLNHASRTLPRLLYTIERFHCGRGLFLLLAVATGFYMLKVPSWKSLPPKY